MNVRHIGLFGGLFFLILLGAARAQNAGAPETPRIDNVLMAPVQPHEKDPATIWYDDFNQGQKAYVESSGGLDDKESFGGPGASMTSVFEKGSRGKGGRKVFFGDCPASRGKTVRRSEKFDDVYWRIYVKHQHGWTGGGPAKLSRATSLASGGWAQAMIAHVWSSGEALTLDPASGVRGGQVVTTRYNDFANLRWLGNKPVSKFKLHATEEAGRWVCVESRAKLNTPGKKDGLNQLWIDGRLEAERRNLDWRGTYDKHGINAVFLESYWNQGSPVTQQRWIDNFVISSKPIGPVVAARNPVLLKTPYRGPGKMQAWEAQLAADGDGKDIVWQSQAVTGAEHTTADAMSGSFAGSHAAKDKLAPGRIFFCRVRQQSAASAWAPWSGWHQPFKTAE